MDAPDRPIPPDEPVDGVRPHRRRRRYSGTHPKRFDERYKELCPEDYPGIIEHVRGQGRTPAGTHVPVMLEEVLACLGPSEGEIAADCTIGHGGHAEAIMARLGPRGLLVGLDVDGGQLARTEPRRD
jgi:16S rRNA (cytosine1402-N4)-methyltransferase